MSKPNTQSIQRQRGAVLVISLIVLLILSIIGVNAVKTTQLEEKMAGNQRDVNYAFQATESALRGGEAWLFALLIRPSSTVALADYATCSTAADVWVLDGVGEFPDVNVKNHQWWQNCGRSFSGSITDVSTGPRYIVEELGFVPDNLLLGAGVTPGRFYYRLTARGSGKTDVAQAFIQSVYVRRY